MLFKNNQPTEFRQHATIEDVEASVPAMLNSGQQFFADIELHQVPPAGLQLLRELAQEQDKQMSNALKNHSVQDSQFEAMVDILQQRELIKSNQQAIIRSRLN